MPASASLTAQRAGTDGTPSPESALLRHARAATVLRDMIARALADDEGVHVPPEAVVVTATRDEALLLTLRALFADRPGVLAVAGRCPRGVRDAARRLGVPVVAIPDGPAGMSLADVDRAVAAEAGRGRRIRALCVVPDAPDGAGTTMSREGRFGLLERARRHDFLVLERCRYREFAGTEQPASLKSLDTDHRVVQLGWYTKAAYPGLRLGYAVAEQLRINPARTHLKKKEDAP